MRQVLFHIPFIDLPIYGYGMMLCLALIGCVILASWLARREGIPPQRIQDMAFWVVIFGLLGARITYMVQYRVPILDFYKVYDGGLVFYGSALGGVIGYVAAYYLVLRKYSISTWKVADIVAPCAALGLCLGRLGCFLNGCCFGNVACAHCPAVSFPLSAPARYALVERGLQTAAGFTVKDDRYGARVERVEWDSPAWQAGLRGGDLIVEADGQRITGYWSVHSKDSESLRNYLVFNWPKGKIDLQLKVTRAGEHPAAAGGITVAAGMALMSPPVQEIALPAFTPWTLRLHPTQLYESISMALLFLVLLAYYPLRQRPGLVMVMFMAGYALHRFLNEILRKDTDPVAFGLTLSQNGSILVLLASLALGGWLIWRKPLAPRTV